MTALHQLLPVYACYDAGDGKLVRVTEAEIPNLDAAKAKAALAFHHEIRDAIEANMKTRRVRGRPLRDPPDRRHRAADGAVGAPRRQQGELLRSRGERRPRRRRHGAAAVGDAARVREAREHDLRRRAARVAPERRRRPLPAERDPDAAARSTRPTTARPSPRSGSRSTSPTWPTPAEPIPVRVRPHEDPGGLLIAVVENVETGEEHARTPAPQGRGRRLVRGRARPAAGGRLPDHVARRQRRAGDGPRHGRRRVVANWAVVVGIDQYWSEGAHLKGAVRDALKVRDLAARSGRRRRARREPPARPGARPEQRGGRPGARRRSSARRRHHRRDQQPHAAERRERRAPLLLLRGPRAHDARLQPRRERAARDRLHERQHRPVDRAPLAVGVLRDDAVRRPVLLRRRVPQRPALGRGRGVRARPLDAPAHARPRHAAGPAVHPLRDLAEAEGDRGARQARRGARRLHGGAARRAARRGEGQGVVVGAAVLRGALGAAGRLREEARRARGERRSARRRRARSSRFPRTAAAAASPAAIGTSS